jgi:hypothetical protein
VSRLLARLQRVELQRQADAAVAHALGTAVAQPRARASAGGDVVAMRGVPIQAKGVGGAVRGSRPGANLR